MGQHRTTNHVTNRPDTGRFGFTVVIHEDETAFVQLNTGVFRQQVIGIWATANGDDQLVKLGFLLTLRIFIGHINQFALDFRTGHTCAQHNVKPLLLELFQCILGNLLVNDWQEGVNRFKYGYLCPQASPYAAQLETDNTCPDNAETLGNLSEFQSALRVHDVRAIERRRWNLDGT